MAWIKPKARKEPARVLDAAADLRARRRELQRRQSARMLELVVDPDAPVSPPPMSPAELARILAERREAEQLNADECAAGLHPWCSQNGRRCGSAAS